MTRVTVFIDYQNVYMRARDSFGGPRTDPSTFGQIQPRRLGLLLRAKGEHVDSARELAEVRVYRGEPDARRNPVGHAAYSQQVRRWAEDARVVLRTRPLHYRPPRGHLARVRSSEALEKGIDVLLALDMVIGAAHDAYDVAVLVSADTDLLPAVEAVIDMGKRVEAAAWRAEKRWSPRLTVPGRNVWCHWLDHADFDRVRDNTDYRRPVDRRASRSETVERFGKLPPVDADRWRTDVDGTVDPTL